MNYTVITQEQYDSEPDEKLRLDKKTPMHSFVGDVCQDGGKEPIWNQSVVIPILI